MCKAVVDVEKVVPIYGRGNDFDPRVKLLVPVPPRPAGQQPFAVAQVICAGSTKRRSARGGHDANRS